MWLLNRINVVYVTINRFLSFIHRSVHYILTLLSAADIPKGFSSVFCFQNYKSITVLSSHSVNVDWWACWNRSYWKGFKRYRIAIVIIWNVLHPRKMKMKETILIWLNQCLTAVTLSGCGLMIECMKIPSE